MDVHGLGTAREGAGRRPATYGAQGMPRPFHAQARAPEAWVMGGGTAGKRYQRLLHLLVIDDRKFLERLRECPRRYGIFVFRPVIRRDTPGQVSAKSPWLL